MTTVSIITIGIMLSISILLASSNICEKIQDLIDHLKRTGNGQI